MVPKGILQTLQIVAPEIDPRRRTRKVWYHGYHDIKLAQPQHTPSIFTGQRCSNYPTRNGITILLTLTNIDLETCSNWRPTIAQLPFAVALVGTLRLGLLYWLDQGSRNGTGHYPNHCSSHFVMQPKVWYGLSLIHYTDMYKYMNR